MNLVPIPDKQTYFDLVWDFVRHIPSGKVVTYGQVTKALPRPPQVSVDDYRYSAPRWVGSAMAACPDDVPWHRVVNAQGKISHASGAAAQKQLLIEEGVVFTTDRIDLSQYQWPGPGQQGQHEQPQQGQLF